jgi:hypothetical protein
MYLVENRWNSSKLDINVRKIPEKRVEKQGRANFTFPLIGWKQNVLPYFSGDGEGYVSRLGVGGCYTVVSASLVDDPSAFDALKSCSLKC